MKVIKDKKSTSESKIQLIKQKKAFKNISSPFLSKLHHQFQSHNKLYFITDLVYGSKLSDYILRKFQLKEKEIKFYTTELVMAIKYLHDNDIVYKGLKPNKILLDTQGHIRLIEPGMSIINEIQSLKGKMSGISNYIAPEILTGNSYSKINDWWSLGAIITEMVSGYPPFLKCTKGREGNYFTIVTNNQIKSSNSLKDFLEKIL